MRRALSRSGRGPFATSVCHPAVRVAEGLPDGSGARRAPALPVTAAQLAADIVRLAAAWAGAVPVDPTTAPGAGTCAPDAVAAVLADVGQRRDPAGRTGAARGPGTASCQR